MPSDLIFLFDLDSTITKQEILPTIARSVGKEEQMRMLTEEAMIGSVPFRDSFLSRVDLLKDVPVSEVSRAIAEIPVHEDLCRFMREHKDRCFIVTGNLDIWIDGLVERMGMKGNVYCSKGIVLDDRLLGVASVIDKNLTVDQFVNPFVAVGDGSNDAEMISRAQVGIGFGGVRAIAPSVLEVASHAIYDEGRLVQFLGRLL
ncbi:MAG: HAD-IB family phosphatase [Coriobacteriia bacterium]|nr:HAD-IB family phosphatase [Coriobacteriia bacterium]